MNINDSGNAQGVTIPSTGTYSSFIVSVDWSEIGGNPYSTEAGLIVSTASGDTTFGTPTTGAANSNAATTITFEGDFAGPYDPSVDGMLDITMSQSWGGSSANWSNIVVTLNPSPDCIEPTGLTVSNVTDTSAQLDWDDMSGVSQFDFEYIIQPAGTGLPTGNGTAIDDITVIENTLSPNTDYEVYVRSDCGGGSYSDWAGPVNFTTLCSPYSIPSLEDFTTFLPGCWDRATGGDIVAGPSNYGFSAWFEDGWLNNGFTGAMKMNIYWTNNNDWVISPLYTISATGYELKFDVALTQWNGTTAPTTPWDTGDYVQLLVSNGNSNWTVLHTYDNTNAPVATGQADIFNLDAYVGQNIRFAFRTVTASTDGADDTDFFVDNFEIRLTPTTPPVCATNVVGTPDASCGNFNNSITWDAVSGADGYYLTLGTTSGGSDVLNNQDMGSATSYDFVGEIGTTYYFTVVPYNGNGPATGCTEVSFSTSTNGCYCDSVPTSLDNNGITNVQIVATNFPNTPVTYTDNSATPVDMSQGINNNVQISFGTGYTYNTYILIDFNDDYNFDTTTELVYSGESLQPNPTTLDASFVMPVTAPLGQHRMRIVSADFMSTVDPCYSGAYGVTIDYTVNIVAASCTPPTVDSSTIAADCANSEYSIDVVVSNLGTATTPSITDGTNSWPFTATGTITVGPFVDASSVTLTLVHGSDPTCDLNLGTFNYTCPAINDNLCDAIALTMNATSSGTDYNNVGATEEANEPSGSCFNSGINGSVWFSFIAPTSGEVIITTDIAGASLIDTEIAVYDATGVNCSDLSTLGASLGCDQDGGTTINYNSILNQPGLTPGNMYYIQVDMWGGTPNGTFGLEVSEVLSNETFNTDSFVAYPNPVKDVLNLEYSSNMTSVRVVNMLGQEVLTKSINATISQLDMSHLNAGTYLVNVTIDNTVKTIKVVKQ